MCSRDKDKPKLQKEIKTMSSDKNNKRRVEKELSKNKEEYRSSNYNREDALKLKINRRND